jgi:predicted HD phosphohydrolase
MDFRHRPARGLPHSDREHSCQAAWRAPDPGSLHDLKRVLVAARLGDAALTSAARHCGAEDLEASRA